MLSHLQQFLTKYSWVFFLVAILGFADATFLSIEHYRGVIPPCSLTNGCETVTTSAYSSIFGVPVAYTGMLYYIALLILLILFVDLKKDIFVKGLFIFTTIGFLFSVYFTILQFFVIKAICPYCLFSAATSTVLFLLCVWGARSNEARNELL